MNKMQIAHDMALELVKIKPSLSAWQIADRCFEYADAMQAEADKRKPKPELPSLQQTFIDGVEQPRCAPTCEEWQPDWSQAPIGYDWFCVGSNGGYGFFSNQAPELFKDYYFVGADGFVVNNHGYQGNWQDSLRKRPQ